MTFNQQKKRYQQLLHELENAAYDDSFFAKARLALKLAKELDTMATDSYEAQLYVTLQRNPNQPLQTMEAACKKRALTGNDLIRLLQPVLYSVGLGLAFAYCTALLTSVIGSVVAVAAAVICALVPIIKKLVVRHQQRCFLQRAKAMLALLPLPEANRLPPRPRQLPDPGRPIQIVMVSIFCYQGRTTYRHREPANSKQLQLLDRHAGYAH
jgi:hypothetical protein